MAPNGSWVGFRCRARSGSLFARLLGFEAPQRCVCGRGRGSRSAHRRRERRTASGGTPILARFHRGNPQRFLFACGERVSSLLSERPFFVKRSPLAMSLASIALASLLAACSSGTTGMLPANPQSQSLAQAPNRAAGAAVSGGMRATVHMPIGANPAAGESPTGATSLSNFGSGIGMAKPMAVKGPPPPQSCTTDGTCVTCPNGSQGDICEVGGGSGSGIIVTPGSGGSGGCSSNVECGQPCYEGGSGCVATNFEHAPQQGQCDGSPSNHEVGNDNMPSDSNAFGTTIVNVFSFENSVGDVEGWIYLTQNENVYYQSNAGSSTNNAFLTFLQGIPVVNGIAQALINATSVPYHLNGTQYDNILSSFSASTYHLHKCWTQNYQQSRPVS